MVSLGSETEPPWSESQQLPDGSREKSTGSLQPPRQRKAKGRKMLAERERRRREGACRREG